MDFKNQQKAIKAFKQFADEILPQVGQLSGIDFENLNDGLIAADLAIKEINQQKENE